MKTHKGLTTLKMVVKNDHNLTKAQRQAFNSLEKCDLECEDCGASRTHRKHPNKNNDTGANQRWTGDTAGPFPRSRNGNYWMFLWKDPYNFGETGFGALKSDVRSFTEENYEVWLQQCPWGFDAARTDRGGEYTSVEFEQWFKSKGIVHTLTAPNSSAGRAETGIRTIKETARAYLNAAGASDWWWDEACAYSCDVANMMPSRAPHLERRSPWEWRYGVPPPLKHLHPWGCLAYANTPKSKTFGNKGRRCTFIGLARGNNDGYRFYDSVTKSVFHANGATFIEDVSGFKNPTETTKPPLKPSTACGHPLCRGKPAGDHHPRCEWSDKREEEVQAEEELGFEEEDDHIGRVAGQRARTQTQLFDPLEWDLAYKHDQTDELNNEIANIIVLLSDEVNSRYNKDGMLKHGMIPNTWKEMISSRDVDKWIEAVDTEKDALKKFNVFKRILRSDIPKGRKTISAKWIWDIKTLMDGTIERYKARLVAKGFMQRLGHDFSETFSPTPSMVSIRFLLALGVQHGWNTRQFDIKAAFLSSKLPEGERIFLEIPEGYKKSHPHVFELLRVLYGLKQAGFAFLKGYNGHLAKYNFSPLDADACVHTHRGKDGAIDNVIVAHVDDGLTMGKGDSPDRAVQMLQAKYEVKALSGSVHGYLGAKIVYSNNGKTVTISQPQLTDAILERFGMNDCNPAHTPCRKVPEVPPEIMSEEEKVFMQDKEYRSVVGCVNYLVNYTRPDLTFAHNYLCRHVNNPRRVHWKAVLQLLAYLKGTRTWGIRYTQQPLNEDGTIAASVGYSDSDHGGTIAERGHNGGKCRSTEGAAFTFAGGLLDWGAHLQTTTAWSSAEAELMALGYTVKRALWIRKLEKGLDVGNGAATVIHEDNAAAIAISVKHRRTKRTKHIDTQYFAVSDEIENGHIEIAPVASADNIADFFTKGLERTKFEFFRNKMGVVDTTLHTH